MKTILVIDDVAANLTTMKAILHSEYEVCLAKSTDAAFMALERTDVDLILLDIAMPGYSGFEFLEMLKAKPAYSRIPVIFVTGASPESFGQRAEQAGAVGFIQKPVNANNLLHQIHDALSNAPAN
jgi:CheY-like chemotaxis protein